MLSTPSRIPCAVPCEVLEGERSHIGRLRAISLAQCAVETSTLRGASGREVILRIPGGSGGLESRVNARVSGELRALELEGGARCEGVELELLQVDRSFFPLLAAAEAAERARLHPLAGSAPGPGAAGSLRPPGAAASLRPGTPPAPAASTTPPAAGPAPPAGEPPAGAAPREERRAERRAVHIPVRLWGSGMEISGTVLNISACGAFVATPAVLPKDTAFHVELELPARVFHYEGVVVHQRTDAAGPTGLGIRFVSVEEALLQSSSLEASRLRPPALRLDLSDPARLAQIYLAEVRHGGLSIPAAAERYLPGSQLRVELLLPPPHAAEAVHAIVLPWTGQRDRLALELCDANAVKERLRQVIREHRPR